MIYWKNKTKQKETKQKKKHNCQEHNFIWWQSAKILRYYNESWSQHINYLPEIFSCTLQNSPAVEPTYEKISSWPWKSVTQNWIIGIWAFVSETIWTLIADFVCLLTVLPNMIHMDKIANLCKINLALQEIDLNHLIFS